MKPPSIILYAEDEENDIFLLDRAFHLARLPHTLSTVPDGEKAIQYLAGEGPFADRVRHPLPFLVLLDINMPKKSGLEVLEWIRRQPHFKTLTVVMLTSSSRPEDREKAGQLGADDYLLKPARPIELVELVNSLHDRWFQQPVKSNPRNRAAVSPSS